MVPFGAALGEWPCEVRDQGLGFRVFVPFGAALGEWSCEVRDQGLEGFCPVRCGLGGMVV